MKITHWELNIERDSHVEPLIEEVSCGEYCYPITVGEVTVYHEWGTVTGTLDVSDMDAVDIMSTVNLADCEMPCGGKGLPSVDLMIVRTDANADNTGKLTVRGTMKVANKVDRTESRFLGWYGR